MCGIPPGSVSSRSISGRWKSATSPSGGSSSSSSSSSSCARSGRSGGGTRSTRTEGASSRTMRASVRPSVSKPTRSGRSLPWEASVAVPPESGASTRSAAASVRAEALFIEARSVGKARVGSHPPALRDVLAARLLAIPYAAALVYNPTTYVGVLLPAAFGIGSESVYSSFGGGARARELQLVGRCAVGLSRQRVRVEVPSMRRYVGRFGVAALLGVVVFIASSAILSRPVPGETRARGRPPIGDPRHSRLAAYSSRNRARPYRCRARTPPKAPCSCRESCGN